MCVETKKTPAYYWCIIALTVNSILAFWCCLWSQTIGRVAPPKWNRVIRLQCDTIIKHIGHRDSLELMWIIFCWLRLLWQLLIKCFAIPVHLCSRSVHEYPIRNLCTLHSLIWKPLLMIMNSLLFTQYTLWFDIFKAYAFYISRTCTSLHCTTLSICMTRHYRVRNYLLYVHWLMDFGYCFHCFPSIKSFHIRFRCVVQLCCIKQWFIKCATSVWCEVCGFVCVCLCVCVSIYEMRFLSPIPRVSTIRQTEANISLCLFS